VKTWRGRYYYRSDSTKQELTGSALDEFMLRKQGKTWDGVHVPYVKESEFHRDAFLVFRKKALESSRLTSVDLEIDDAALFSNLMLTEGDYLKRAAILLFHQHPENWVPGCHVKIGYFENDANITYQDEIRGSLITLPDNQPPTQTLPPQQKPQPQKPTPPPKQAPKPPPPLEGIALWESIVRKTVL